MKLQKFFAFLVLGMLSTVAIAATSNAKIVIKSQAHTSYKDYVTLKQADTYAADFSDCIEDLASSSNNYVVNMWALNGTSKFATVKKQDINGLKIVFKANKADLNYVMSFENVSGDSIKLQKGSDAEHLISVDPSQTFNFTCTAVEEEVEFTVVMPKTYTRELPVGKWGTICFPYEISKVEGAAVYSVKARNSESTLLALEVAPDTLVKGAIYMFNATEDEQVFTYAGEAATAAADANGCYGVFAADGITISDAGAYVLNGDALVNATVGFTHVGQYRAWFKVSDITTEGFNAPGRIILKIAGQATELETIEAANADGKMLINGQLIIIKDGVRYNAMGAKL